MSMNIKEFISFDRFDQDRHGRKIPVYRCSEMYLDKDEVREARKHKENLRLNVT